MAKTTFTYDTKLSADSVEWCPQLPNLLALGTYQVDRNNEDTFSGSQRHGKLSLFSQNEADEVELIHGQETPAILDMKWCHSLPNPTLALTTSTGFLQLYTFEAESRLLKLGSSVQLEESPVILSLDWNDRSAVASASETASTSDLEIVVSDSLGFITTISVGNNLQIKVS